MSSNHLCIRVTRDGEVKVEVTLPRRTFDWFETLIPPETRESIARRGLDLAAIKAGVQARDYAPGPVFELAEAGKLVEVWLK